MKKPFILTLVPDSITHPTGGMGVECKYLIENLSGDFDFKVLGHPDTEAPDYFTGVYNRFPNMKHGPLLNVAGQLEYFFQAIKSDKPDIIHIHDWTLYWTGVYLADYFKVPLVMTMQLSIKLLNQIGIFYAQDINSHDGFAINKMHTEMEILGLQRSDVIVQVSHEYAKPFNQIPGLQEKTVIVPHGIDLSEWDTYEKIELPGTRKFKIVYIGRIAPMKNIEAILEAQIPDDIDLIFVGTHIGGDHFLFERMKSFAQEHDNVHYYGPAYGQDKINLLKSADAVLMPSIHEPFGIVALEALASESILLSSFAGGMKDFLSEDVAIHCGVTPRSIESAYDTFLSLSKKDKASRIQKGLEICKEYSWVHAAEKMKKVYLEILKNNKK